MVGQHWRSWCGAHCGQKSFPKPPLRHSWAATSDPNRALDSVLERGAHRGLSLRPIAIAHSAAALPNRSGPAPPSQAHDIIEEQTLARGICDAMRSAFFRRGAPCLRKDQRVPSLTCRIVLRARRCCTWELPPRIGWHARAELMQADGASGPPGVKRRKHLAADSVAGDSMKREAGALGVNASGRLMKAQAFARYGWPAG